LLLPSQFQTELIPVQILLISHVYAQTTAKDSCLWLQLPYTWCSPYVTTSFQL